MIQLLPFAILIDGSDLRRLGSLAAHQSSDKTDRIEIGIIEWDPAWANHTNVW